MEKCWDHRLRHHYGERFDFRVNVIDWDFQEHVRPVAGLVHPLLFRAWRKTGLAFEFGDETYTQPNRTMSSYALVSDCALGAALLLPRSCACRGRPHPLPESPHPPLAPLLPDPSICFFRAASAD